MIDSSLKEGTIVSVDSQTDTCVVTVGGSDYNVPIFYHCTDQDTVVGGSAAFREDDCVVVLYKNNSPYRVIAHCEGRKDCVTCSPVIGLKDGSYLYMDFELNTIRTAGNVGQDCDDDGLRGINIEFQTTQSDTQKNCKKFEYQHTEIVEILSHMAYGHWEWGACELDGLAPDAECSRVRWDALSWYDVPLRDYITTNETKINFRNAELSAESFLTSGTDCDSDQVEVDVEETEECVSGDCCHEYTSGCDVFCYQHAHLTLRLRLVGYIKNFAAYWYGYGIKYIQAHEHTTYNFTIHSSREYDYGYSSHSYNERATGAFIKNEIDSDCVSIYGDFEQEDVPPDIKNAYSIYKVFVNNTELHSFHDQYGQVYDIPPEYRYYNAVSFEKYCLLSIYDREDIRHYYLIDMETGSILGYRYIPNSSHVFGFFN